MKNQKGFAPILLIAVVVVAVAAIGIGYVVTNKGKTGQAGLLPKVQLPGISTLNADCKLKDPELCRYVNQAAKMPAIFEKGFSGTSVTTVKDGKKTESVWEMQGDKSHFKSLSDGKEEADMIVIGNTTYTKDLKDGKWFKYTAQTTGEKSSQSGLFDINQMKSTIEDSVKEAEDKTTYKALGKAPCGSLTCFKYQIVVPELNEATTYLYFDDKEYLMRMMESSSSFGTTVSTFNYGTVTINEPSPVKTDDRFGIYDPSIIEKTGGSVSSIDMEKLKQDLQEMMKNNTQVPQEGSSSDVSGGE
jgi:hypothetical protein